MAGLLTASETTAITATIAASLDQSLPQARKETAVNDGYGHTSTAFASVGNVACTVAKPTATELVTYAGVIGSKRAMFIRAMGTTDIREGDQITYDGLLWVIHERLNANSYSVTTRYLMITVV